MNLNNTEKKDSNMKKIIPDSVLDKCVYEIDNEKTPIRN